MKKFTRVVALLVSLCAICSAFAGCRDTSSNYDPETRPLTMSIGALDGNFNPFFYTAQNDGTVVGMTQVSMLASDADGNPVCGEDRPTVSKDFKITEVGTGDDKYTTYEFLIKNGMKYSDGNDLTIMDVLFNYYVYLDEAYIGSNTLYSTDIKGLNAYHAQDPELGDDADNDTYETFLTSAYTRLNDLLEYCEEPWSNDLTEQMAKDALTIINLFKEEVKSDWTSVENSFNSRDLNTYEYRFTKVWQAYLFNEGIVKQEVETNATGATVPKKDANGDYVTSLDMEVGEDDQKEIIYNEDNIWEVDLNEYITEDKIQAYVDGGATREQAIEYLERDWAIDFVFSAMTGFDSVNDSITSLDGASWNTDGVAEIAQYWATGSKAIEQFTSEARTEYYESIFNGTELQVPTIEGITAYRTTSFNGKSLTEAHDVLKIVVNKVDPKAIWNFSITVAPMHYYSTAELVAEAEADYQNYLQAYENGRDYKLTKFAVKFADADFFGEGVNGGLQSGDKNRLPMGAGAYKASTINGGNATAGSFHSNKFVYYERNPYFNTMGEKLNNAVIKSVRYAEIGDDKVITALVNQEIDYGMPSGNAENSARITEASSYLGTAKYMSNGYGYVGINPYYVPELELRQAIMKALDTTSTVRNYYTQEWASVIHRPMSANSWAYPTNAEAYADIAFTNQASEINALIRQAGYELNGDLYEKDGKQLKLTFTIAGSSTEHPAYKMFVEAEKFLEQYCYMDITVATDIQALKKLASGKLAVWAAAWSSAIDPDMYQVYHKDSKATSVKNWNYPAILADQTGKFSREYDIIQDLSDLIDRARQTTVQSDRKQYYALALDKVMELAVELPTYQRYDYEVYNKKIINRDSLTENPSAYSPLLDRLWEVSYN